MKKLLLVFLSIVLVSSSAFAYDASSRVETVGKTILEKNGISISNVKFMTVSGAVDNSSYATNKVINVSTNDLAYAGNDNEVAAVVSNTLGHIIAGHSSKGKLVSMFTADTTTTTTSTATQSLIDNYKVSKQDKEADVIAVNLMANSGYTPLALIVVLTKQTASSWETIAGKPANGDRALNVYEYTKYAYPAKEKAGYNCNEYKTFMNYANTAINSRTAKQTKKVNKEITKFRKNSVNQISKFKVRGGITGWDAAYSILNSTQQ